MSAKPCSFHSGFTLIELMVVVAIIGGLSAVAVPQYKRYQAKAKTTEALMHLSSIYTAEQAFFADYNMYHICLKYMGYDPSSEVANRYYSTGFGPLNVFDTTALASAINSGLNTSPPEGCGASLQEGYSAFSAGKGIGNSRSSQWDLWGSCLTEIGTQGSESTMTFVAGASGVISATNTNYTGANLRSCFKINQAKVIQNVYLGY